VYEILVCFTSNSEFAICTVTPCYDRFRADERIAHGRVRVDRLNQWRSGLLMMLSCCFTFVMWSQETPVPAALTSPAPGGTFAGTSETFAWTTGNGVTLYDIYLGTTGVGSDNLYTTGHITATSTKVTGLPAIGATVYARLWSFISGAWQYTDYTYTESGAPAKAILTAPAPGNTFTGTSEDFSWTTGNGVTLYDIYLGTTGVGSDNLYTTGHITATSITVTGLPAIGATVYARLWSYISGAWQYTDYTYTESGTPAKAVLTTPTPGNPFTSTSESFTWTTGNGVTLYDLYLGTTGVGSDNLYTTGHITATSTKVTGLPAIGATVYARLWSYISGAWQSTDYTYTEAGASASPTLTGVSCSSKSITGSEADSCTVTLSAAPANGGLSVNLSSSNAAVSVPATVMVPANAISAVFTANVSPVMSAQTVTLTASEDGASATVALQLNAATPTLSISASSLAFGAVSVNTTATQSLILTSAGTASVTVNTPVLTGPGFTMLGGMFPITLNPTQTVTLDVEFDPETVGAATGQLSITSNSLTGGTAVISLTGTGEQVQYQVNLSWDVPTGSVVPVAGYNVYRSTSGSSPYQEMNSSVDSQTTYVDTTVASGVAYQYYVETVGTSGVASAPSSTFGVTIP
jgi:hypothetical protein